MLRYSYDRGEAEVIRGAVRVGAPENEMKLLRPAGIEAAAGEIMTGEIPAGQIVAVKSDAV